MATHAFTAIDHCLDWARRFSSTVGHAIAILLISRDVSRKAESLYRQDDAQLARQGLTRDALPSVILDMLKIS
ncbi:MAG: hypothetical protein ACI853_002095 [Paracoccaceae bacterium]|jgi:hypothetical protein